MAGILMVKKELTAVAEDPQQHQEQVDEVQIQGQRAKNGIFAQVRRVAGINLLTHIFQFLGVIRRQSDKDNHADVCDCPHQRFAFQPEVDQRCQHNADQRHKQHIAETT